MGLGDSRGGIKGKARVDLGGDSTRHDFQDIDADIDGEFKQGVLQALVGISRLLLRPVNGIVDVIRVFRVLCDLEQQLWVGCGVFRMVLLYGIDLTGIRDHRSHGFQLIQPVAHSVSTRVVRGAGIDPQLKGRVGPGESVSRGFQKNEL